ncbi:MAG: OsmC family protein [Candidatus Omnitrophica bacterium]|nr:OsmC family protein [Candidatus Omnitrophota bacterium]
MYNVEITHNQDLAFTAKSGQGEFVIDAQGQGITPLDALLAGLGSCIGVYIRKYAQGAKLDLKNFKINVSGDLGSQSPFSFKLINVQLDLRNAGLDDRRQRALLEFIKNCPAHNTLKGNPVIEFKLLC